MSCLKTQTGSDLNPRPKGVQSTPPKVAINGVRNLLESKSYQSLHNTQIIYGMFDITLYCLCVKNESHNFIMMMIIRAIAFYLTTIFNKRISPL